MATAIVGTKIILDGGAPYAVGSGSGEMGPYQLCRVKWASEPLVVGLGSELTNEESDELMQPLRFIPEGGTIALMQVLMVGSHLSGSISRNCLELYRTINTQTTDPRIEKLLDTEAKAIYLWWILRLVEDQVGENDSLMPYIYSVQDDIDELWKVSSRWQHFDIADIAPFLRGLDSA